MAKNQTISDEMQRSRYVSSIQGHIPGKHFRHSDGAEYIVTGSGAWKRTTPRKCDDSQNTKNHSVRRRAWAEYRKGA